MTKLIHTSMKFPAVALGLAFCLTICLGTASGQTQSAPDTTAPRGGAPAGTPYVPPPPSKYHLGLALAPNASFGMSRDYAHWNEGLVGQFGFRFIFDIMFTETYAISTGIHVFNTGGRIMRYQATDGGMQSELEVIEQIELVQRLQYVELPVTFKMRTREIGYTTFLGEFGLGLGVNTRAEADERRVISHTRDAVIGGDWGLTGATFGEESQRVIMDQREESGEYANWVKSFRPAMIIGLGLERRFTGSTALHLGLTYNMGLNSIYNNDAFHPDPVRSTDDELPRFFDGETDPVKMHGKSSSLSLSVGLMF
jgi:hypothetical protein